MAIAEYAPGSQVVADGKMYVSRYIRKMPGKKQGILGRSVITALSVLIVVNQTSLVIL